MSDILNVGPEVELENLTTPAAELTRIDFTGTIWFAAAVIGVSIPLGSLLASGWRPSQLPDPLDVVFWVGAVVSLVGSLLLIWAGCPVFGFGPDEARRQKIFCIRVGIVSFFAGAVVAAFAILLSPVPTPLG